MNTNNKCSRIGTAILLLLLVFHCNGCCTLFTRAAGFRHEGIYPATKCDTEISRDVYHQAIYYQHYSYILLTPLILIDYPISITLDTLLLPIDIFDQSKQQ